MIDDILNFFRGGGVGTSPVPMAPQPSIVKAQEDEDIYVDNSQVPATVAQRVSAGVPQESFFDNHTLASAMPVPVEEPPVPPQLAEPGTIVPPETNETLLDEMGVPPVPEGVPGTERDEAQAHYDRTAARIAEIEAAGGDASNLIASNEILKGKIDAGEFSDELTKDEQFYRDYRESQKTGHRKRLAEMQIEKEKRLREEGRIEEANNLRRGMESFMKDGNEKQDKLGIDVPMPENSEAPPTPDEAAALEDALAGARPEPRPVRTKDGKTVEVSTEDAKRVAAEDPKGFAKAMGWVQKTFGITGQDLARFALLYAGSRIAGYDHGESMSWGFEVAAKDLLSRREVGNTMAQTGKYTPESIEEYRKTGDVGKLKAVNGGNTQKVDFTKTAYMPGKKGPKPVYPAQDKDGNRYWVDRNGKRVEGDVIDVERRRKAIQEGTDDAVKSYTKTIEEMVEVNRKKLGRDENSPYNFSANGEAKAMAEVIMDWNVQHGTDIDSAVAHRLIQNAMRQAEAWSAATGNKEVNELMPFLNAQMIYMDESNTWATHLNKDGRELNPDEIATMNNDVLSFMMNDPGFLEKQKGIEKGALMNAIMEQFWIRYDALDDADKKRQTFYEFIRKQTTTER